MVGGADVLFVATAEARDGEMRSRIAHHQQSRSADWQTLERTQDLSLAIKALATMRSVVLIDCLTLLVSNIMCSLQDILCLFTILVQATNSFF